MCISCKPAVTVSKPVIENQIRGILKLPSVEYLYREVIYVGQEAKFLGIKHLDKRLLFSIDITVKAGIDLTKGLEIRSLANQKIQVVLPEPEVLQIDADESSINQFFVKEWGDKISRLDYYDEIVKSKTALKDDAVQRNILYKARINSEDMILRILNAYGIPDVSFQWEEYDGS